MGLAELKRSAGSTNMRRRRMLIYICIIFLTFETFLLLEQQKNINTDVLRYTRNQYTKATEWEGAHTSGSNLSSEFNRSDDRKVKSTPGKATHYAFTHSTLSSTFGTHNGISTRNPPTTIVSFDVNPTTNENPLPYSTTKTVPQELPVKPTFAKDDWTKQRLDRTDRICQSPVQGDVVRVLIDPARTISYCVAHKVASTNWLRVFRFLWNATSMSNVSSPSQISKWEAHLSNHRLTYHNFSNDADRSLIFNTSRFMFVREPFTRLWSVFIDKFILADNYFWSFYGPKIARVNGLVILPSVKPCYHFTFEHFINFVLDSASEPDTMDDHIRPVHRLCNPCLFKPNFIGKLETMDTDRNKVLRVMGVKWGEQGSDPVFDEIKTIVDFNFHIVYDLRLLYRCLTPVLLGRRILRAFVLNGYIPENAESAMIKLLPLPKERLVDVVWDFYKSTNRTREMVKTQRLEMKAKAFLSIPLKKMHALQKIYRKDFELFDYRLDPPELFYNKRFS